MSTRVESGNAELEVRLGAPESPAGAVGVALLAHPLGWLGGSMDDPVMVRVEQALGRRGWYTVSFNSRGVGSSTGSPSWTGAAECDDMAAVLAYATSRHLDLLPHPHPHPYPRQLLLVGYSAGALYTSTLSPPEGWHTRVVLLSYPRDYIWALSLFQSARFTRGIDHLVASKTRLLFIHGTQDQFSKHKVRPLPPLGRVSHLHLTRDSRSFKTGPTAYVHARTVTRQSQSSPYTGLTTFGAAPARCGHYSTVWYHGSTRDLLYRLGRFLA